MFLLTSIAGLAACDYCNGAGGLGGRFFLYAIGCFVSYPFTKALGALFSSVTDLESFVLNTSEFVGVLLIIGCTSRWEVGCNTFTGCTLVGTGLIVGLITVAYLTNSFWLAALGLETSFVWTKHFESAAGALKSVFFFTFSDNYYSFNTVFSALYTFYTCWTDYYFDSCNLELSRGS